MSPPPSSQRDKGASVYVKQRELLFIHSARLSGSETQIQNTNVENTEKVHDNRVLRRSGLYLKGGLCSPKVIFFCRVSMLTVILGNPTYLLAWLLKLHQDIPWKKEIQLQTQ